MIRFRTAQALHTPTDLHAANLAQRRMLLASAPPKDLVDLVPILDERVRATKDAYDKACAELADVLLQMEAARG